MSDISPDNEAHHRDVNHGFASEPSTRQQAPNHADVPRTAA